MSFWRNCIKGAAHDLMNWLKSSHSYTSLTFMTPMASCLYFSHLSISDGSSLFSPKFLCNPVKNVLHLFSYTELLREEAMQKLTKNQKIETLVSGVGSLNRKGSLDTYPHSSAFIPKWQFWRFGLYYLVTTEFLVGTISEEIFFAKLPQGVIAKMLLLRENSWNVSNL